MFKIKSYITTFLFIFLKPYLILELTLRSITKKVHNHEPLNAT